MSSQIVIAKIEEICDDIIRGSMSRIKIFVMSARLV